MDDPVESLKTLVTWINDKTKSKQLLKGAKVSESAEIFRNGGEIDQKWTLGEPEISLDSDNLALSLHF